MKKKFKIEVDCAACAAKLENAIGKVEGVESCKVNFLMQQMTLTAAEESFDETLQRVIKTAKRIEPDAVISAS